MDDPSMVMIIPKHIVRLSRKLLMVENPKAINIPRISRTTSWNVKVFSDFPDA
jgi:hypothetical protein